MPLKYQIVFHKTVTKVSETDLLPCSHVQTKVTKV